jgi:hypothetical protein
MSAEGRIVEKSREFASTLKELSLDDRTLQHKMVNATLELENLKTFLEGRADEKQKQFVSQWYSYLHFHNEDIELLKKEIHFYHVDFPTSHIFAEKKFKDIFHKNINYYLMEKKPIEKNYAPIIPSSPQMKNLSGNSSITQNPKSKFIPPAKRQKLNDFKKGYLHQKPMVSSFFNQSHQNNEPYQNKLDNAAISRGISPKTTE